MPQILLQLDGPGSSSCSWRQDWRVAHTQSPLFFSNQNQYLLHGLAQAGYGHLDHDWLANTKDPTPAFSFLVKWLYKFGGLFAIQAAYFVLLMYFGAMWRLITSFASPPVVPFAAIFTAAHAAIFRLMSVQISGVDYPWYFQAGLAGQYLLGPGLQPSAFGVLLIGSLAEFVRRPSDPRCLVSRVGRRYSRDLFTSRGLARARLCI